ncbi:MAG TPA: hypothetical protein VFU13_08815 [Steroidobacteraceae bacterium]|nr:hypothetical protein [Steroidobacteraceae bacterium]
MRAIPLLITLLALLPLTACQRSLDEREVLEFIDKADDAARKRFAPEICELRGKDFELHLTFQGHERQLDPSELTIDRKLFCKEAGKFSRLRQYRLERNSIDVDVAADRKTARVVSEYVETMPYYDPDMIPSTPDDFRHFQVVETTDESVVGIESGDIVFLRTDSNASQSLVSKSSVSLPYD